jgi:hypothetical protein
MSEFDIQYANAYAQSCDARIHESPSGDMSMSPNDVLDDEAWNSGKRDSIDSAMNGADKIRTSSVGVYYP